MEFYSPENYQPRKPPTDRIDWRARRIAELALKGKKLPRPLRFKDEGYDVEITPQLGGAILNGTVDDMDVLWVNDTRDNTRWIMFRSEMGHDVFESILPAIRLHGQMEYTVEPTASVERLYQNRLNADLSRADTFPAEWVLPPAEA